MPRPDVQWVGGAHVTAAVAAEKSVCSVTIMRGTKYRYLRKTDSACAHGRMQRGMPQLRICPRMRCDDRLARPCGQHLHSLTNVKNVANAHKLASCRMMNASICRSVYLSDLPPE